MPVNLKLVVEGSEEQGTGGLEDASCPSNADLLRADAILVCDTGNAAVGHPAADRQPARHGQRRGAPSSALPRELHSGMFGGAAPDALAALVAMLATLRDDARATPRSSGLDNTQTWPARPTRPSSSAATPASLEGVSLLGAGTVSDMLWARPAITILGIDCPPVVGLGRGDRAATRAARLNLRIPPGHRAARGAERALIDAPAGRGAVGRLASTVEIEATGLAVPRRATDGPAYRAMRSRDAGGLRAGPMALLGQGGSIPLCNVFAETYPDAEMMLMGVEEPLALIHAPNESVDPTEIERMALTEALFLERYASTGS